MKFAKLFHLLLSFFLIATIGFGPVVGQRRPAPERKTERAGTNEVERRIDALLARMTLEEKLGQLQQLDGHADGRYKDEHPDLIRRGLLGSTLNVRGTRNTNELQRIAVEQSRLKIPMIFGFDVIHGYRTIFPIPLGESASWDPAGVERAAAIAHVGEGTVVEAEAGDGDDAYEVAVELADGSVVEINLDEGFNVVGSEAGDGSGEGSDGDSD